MAILRGQQLEFEGLAQEVRRRAGVDDGRLELVSKMATALLGRGAVRLVPGMRGAAYLKRSQKGGWYIVVNPDMPDVRFNLAHELAEWALVCVANFRGTELERERAANYVAAAILAPARAVLHTYVEVGERYKKIADRFGLSQTSAVLRLAEVRGDDRAIVTRSGNVLVRTQGAFPWAEVPVVEVARGRPWTGLSSTRLRGGIDEGRVALRAR
jgi:hypothetical protein